MQHAQALLVRHADTHTHRSPPSSGPAPRARPGARAPGPVHRAGGPRTPSPCTVLRRDFSLHCTCTCCSLPTRRCRHSMPTHKYVPASRIMKLTTSGLVQKRLPAYQGTVSIMHDCTAAVAIDAIRASSRTACTSGYVPSTSLSSASLRDTLIIIRTLSVALYLCEPQPYASMHLTNETAHSTANINQATNGSMAVLSPYLVTWWLRTSA
jgi:hypothetical protein